jgi:ribonuclease R
LLHRHARRPRRGAHFEPARAKPGFFTRAERRREGKVIRILTRANETIVGTLQRSKNFFYVVADDPRFVQNLYVQPPAPPLSAKVGDKVVAKLDSWISRHVNPEGHIIEILGPAGAPGVDMLSIIRKHRLPSEFPHDVLREAERVSPEVDPADAAKREDLRDRFIFTIDPDDAKDFDDAINVERIPDGWRVGIHIADVSHYVKPKTALDREAHSRGNSVYSLTGSSQCFPRPSATAFAASSRRWTAWRFPSLPRFSKVEKSSPFASQRQ